MDDALLEAHVERFNEAVRSGDYAPMLAAFAPDAEMAFEGVAAGPFVGREAIAAAYAAQPPTDEVLLLGPIREEDGRDCRGLCVGRRRRAGGPDAAERARRPHHPSRGDIRAAPRRSSVR